MYTHTSLFRLVLRVQKQVEINGGNTENDQWKEVVEDLWDNQLSHFQKGVYKYVHTGQYGFQEGSEKDSKDSLMDNLMNEPARKSRTKEEGEGGGQPKDEGKFIHLVTCIVYVDLANNLKPIMRAQIIIITRGLWRREVANTQYFIRVMPTHKNEQTLEKECMMMVMYTWQ